MDLASIYPHPKWFKSNRMHGKLYLRSQETCTKCHSNETTGSLGNSEKTNNVPACTQCHPGFPHNETWKKTFEHGSTFLQSPESRESCKSCHGTDLKGGSVGVSCTKCHSYPHNSKWAQPKQHGETYVELVKANAPSKDAKTPAPMPDFKECMSCHSPTSGFSSRHPNQATSCSSCHADMPHREKFMDAEGKFSLDHADYITNHPEKESSCFGCHANSERHSPQIAGACVSCHKQNPPFKYMPIKPVGPPTTGPGAPPAEGPTEISTQGLTLDWNTVFTKAIEPACVRCHNERDPKGKINVDSYEATLHDMKAVAHSIEDGSMPKKGEFTALQRCLILEWVKAGGPQQSSTQPQCTTAGGSGLGEIEVPTSSMVTVEEEILARGKYLFRLSACAGCHASDPKASSKDPDLKLGGGHEFDLKKLGKMYAPNISTSKEHGIGNWTPQQFLRAMRDGISPKNEYYYPVFPYQNYSRLSDEDIMAIYRYMMTLPADETPSIPLALHFPFNQRNTLFVWRKVNFDGPMVNPKLAKGFDYDEGMSPSWNRGAYLVEGAMHCTQCHTPREPYLNGLRPNLWFSGSEMAGGDRPGPNLTPDEETGLNHWSKEDWIKLMSTGKTPRGELVSGEMWPFIKDVLAVLTKRDKAAVADYMMSLPPVKNEPLSKLIKEKNTEKP